MHVSNGRRTGTRRAKVSRTRHILSDAYVRSPSLPRLCCRKFALDHLRVRSLRCSRSFLAGAKVHDVTDPSVQAGKFRDRGKDENGTRGSAGPTHQTPSGLVTYHHGSQGEGRARDREGCNQAGEAETCETSPYSRVQMLPATLECQNAPLRCSLTSDISDSEAATVAAVGPRGV